MVMSLFAIQLFVQAKVPDPVAVRYVWAGNPENTNLYNYEVLPVSPFRIDAWK